jgi:hypothetical protein
MCHPTSYRSLFDWLAAQERALLVWRRAAETDPDAAAWAERLERHAAWLAETREALIAEAAPRQTPRAPLPARHANS